MIVQCCVCKKFRQDGTWTNPNNLVADGQSISHGYCPECAENAFAQLAMHAPMAVGKSARESSAA
jgi:hypothetical protein